MVQVGELTIGEGKPKICASITETTRKAVIAAADILFQKHLDIVEWRIDFYEDVEQWEMVKETLHRLKMSLCGKPLLVTFRSSAEGGNRQLPSQDYQNLLEHIAQSGYADMIDVEVFQRLSYEELISAQEEGGSCEQYQELRQWIGQLREHVVIVGSYHNFDKTPAYDEMVQRLEIIAQVGVDIPKMAVMPQSKRDVLQLMNFTLDASEKLDKPLITMSMGKLGSISRVAGEAFGSAVTFGSIGQESAPGQLAVNRLEEMLDLIHQNYQ